MSSWHTQDEVDALVRERVSDQLRKDIAAYDGALEKWRKGLHDVEFPLGTWWLVRFHCAPVVAVPARE